MDLSLTQQILLWAFLIALVMGAVVNKTHFCTMGAVSDWVNMDDTGRIRAWLFAIAVALGGVMLMEAFAVADMGLTTSNDTGQPPYRVASFVWPRYIIGGILFGIGMTLGSGCGNKTMVRVGAGNLKSLVVLVVMGAAAALMLYTSFDYYVFLQWMNPVSIDLAANGIQSQEAGAILGGLLGVGNTAVVHYIIGAALVLFLVLFCFKAAEFHGRFDNILGGAVVGLAVIGGWYVTAGPLGQAWLEEIMWATTPPAAAGAQSYTFVSPSGQGLYYLASGLEGSLVTFAMMGMLGVIVGSLVWALVTRGFRLEWFASLGDGVRHVTGGALMGIGGVLGMGCTIGQGVTGFSTLAVGSVLTFASIVFGAALTMKVQYYRMVYEEEASFYSAFVTSLVDMHLLPKGLRRLEAI